MAKSFDRLVKRTTTKKTRRRAADRTRALLQSLPRNGQQKAQIEAVKQALTDVLTGKVLTEDEFDADRQTW
jgi:predicted transcriptional regulator